MIDLIIIIMAGIVLLFLLSCCFMVARLLDEEISMYGYEGKENWEREQLPDKLSRSSTDLLWKNLCTLRMLCLKERTENEQENSRKTEGRVYDGEKTAA